MKSWSMAKIRNWYSENINIKTDENIVNAPKISLFLDLNKIPSITSNSPKIWAINTPKILGYVYRAITLHLHKIYLVINFTNQILLVRT